MTRVTPSSQYSSPNDASNLHGSQSPHGVGGGGGGDTGGTGGTGGIVGTSSPSLFFRFAMMPLALLLLGCGPGSPTNQTPPTVYQISPHQLATIYRHDPRDRTWINQHVECHLKPQTYSVLPDRIEAHCVNQGRSGCVHFFTTFAPKDNTQPLILVGICRGITRDGMFREPGVDYFVHVDVVSLRQ